MAWMIWAWAALLPVFLAALWAHDRLARLEYERHREQWERDGRPQGIFWREPGNELELRVRSDSRTRMLWLFKTPDWCREETSARTYLWTLRAGAVLWQAAVLVLGFAMGRARGWW